MIQDRRFDGRSQLQYLHAMPERMMGFLGDTILVNGKPQAQFSVKTRAYRFRAVNGSNSRIYKLGWDDGTPLIAIGTDAALLAKPETRPYIMLAPGERVDLWLDFSGRAVGSRLTLYSLAYSGALPGMHGGMDMMQAQLAQGAKFPIAVFNINEKVGDSPKLPQTLVPFQRLSEADTDNRDNPIPIALSIRHMRPLLNGLSFSMDRVTDYEKVALGSIKKIRIFHDHGGAGREHATGMGMGRMGGMRRGGDEAGQGMGGMGGMSMDMAHPIHLHGQQYQILSRNAAKTDAADYATVKDGFIDSGWKDTVLVMPGEEVNIVKPFQDYKAYFCTTATTWNTRIWA